MGCSQECKKEQGNPAGGRKAEEQSRLRNQEADVNAKRIFGNHTLCAQFLRDYAGLPMLSDVQPEDIEDVTERYHLFREVEFQTDTVKKVHVRKQKDMDENDIYILSLIEHKSSVDYDITMQILKYMVCIWENEAAEEGTLRENDTIEIGKTALDIGAEEIVTNAPGGGTAETGVQEERIRIRKNRRKDYRYPPIFPIVYYEGSGGWTAARSLKDRILLGDLFEAYIPDFTYKLVMTQDYTKEELLSREDAISLLMLLNKIQQAKDFEELSALPTVKLNAILQRAPVDVAEIILSAVRGLCRRLNLTEKETEGLMREMEAGNMGYLWENMEKMDIQLERRNTAEARQRAEQAEKKAEQAEKKAEQEKTALSRLLINAYQEQGMDEETIVKRLVKETGMDQNAAEELLEKSKLNHTEMI